MVFIAQATPELNICMKVRHSSPNIMLFICILIIFITLTISLSDPKQIRYSSSQHLRYNRLKRLCNNLYL